MTTQEKSLIQNFILRKIDFSELEREFPSKIDEEYLIEELSRLTTSKDGEALDYLIVLAYRIGFTDSIGRLLIKLLLEPWHEEHEEIGRVLKFYLTAGALESIESKGVRNDASARIMGYFPTMPSVVTVNNWTNKHAMFKTEGSSMPSPIGPSGQINIGLGKGDALDDFNSNILAFETMQ